MNQIPEIIDKALEKTGTVSALGKALGISPAMVSMWKSGAKPCPPEDQARIAAVAGIDPIQTLVRAHIEKHEGTEKGDQLARVLGKFLVATGAAVATSGASAAAIFSPTSKSLFDLIRCIVRLNHFSHFNRYSLNK
jgi:predicted transcriptional regulator